jgi:hypothetical protein
VFEKLTLRPRNVSRPCADPGAGEMPCENGLANAKVDVRSPSSEVISGVWMPKPFDAEMPTTLT